MDIKEFANPPGNGDPRLKYTDAPKVAYSASGPVTYTAIQQADMERVTRKEVTRDMLRFTVNGIDLRRFGLTKKDIVKAYLEANDINKNANRRKL